MEEINNKQLEMANKVLGLFGAIKTDEQVGFLIKVLGRLLCRIVDVSDRTMVFMASKGDSLEDTAIMIVVGKEQVKSLRNLGNSIKREQEHGKNNT
jgi:hypothetical protein